MDYYSSRECQNLCICFCWIWAGEPRTAWTSLMGWIAPGLDTTKIGWTSLMGWIALGP